MSSINNFNVNVYINSPKKKSPKKKSVVTSKIGANVITPDGLIHRAKVLKPRSLDIGKKKSNKLLSLRKKDPDFIASDGSKVYLDHKDANKNGGLFSSDVEYEHQMESERLQELDEMEYEDKWFNYDNENSNSSCEISNNSSEDNGSFKCEFY